MPMSSRGSYAKAAGRKGDDAIRQNNQRRSGIDNHQDER